MGERILIQLAEKDHNYNHQVYIKWWRRSNNNIIRRQQQPEQWVPRLVSDSARDETKCDEHKLQQQHWHGIRSKCAQK